MKMRPLEAELFRVDGQTDRQTDRQMERRDEANIRFLQFCERA